MRPKIEFGQNIVGLSTAIVVLIIVFLTPFILSGLAAMGLCCYHMFLVATGWKKIISENSSTISENNIQFYSLLFKV